jgi:anthranilate synthase component 1
MKRRTLVADGITPVGAYAALRAAAGPAGASFLLESVVGGERWGRFSALGYRPRWEVALCADRRWRVYGDAPEAARALTSVAPGGDPLAALAPLLAWAPAPPASGASAIERLACTHVGYFGWDLVHVVDRVAPWPGPTDAPVARLFGGATMVVFDNFSQTLTIVAPTDEDVARAEADLTAPTTLGHVALPDPARLPAEAVVDIDDARFCGMVSRAQEYIAAGDAFQIVLARTWTVPRRGRDPLDVYRAMRVINPSPYMYFLDMPPPPGSSARPTQILGASPETLVRLEDGTVTVRPIAGTRPRGRTPDEDFAREAELRADAKELAEHVMLIDLGRNDVGRVASVGSVRLTRQMEIERYSHVMHIVSEVEGHVDPAHVGPVDVLRAAFPAGTLSGAPKLRAMQIIRELEGGPRGVYGGAVGYLGATELDVAIAIRTAVCDGDTFKVTAGAGVVEGSEPAHEAAETRNKARAVLASIEAAERRD